MFKAVRQDRGVAEISRPKQISKTGREAEISRSNHLSKIERGDGMSHSNHLSKIERVCSILVRGCRI